MIQNTHDWANFVFGNCDLNDKRREKRLVRMAGGLADNIGKSVVKSSSTPASTRESSISPDTCCRLERVVRTAIRIQL